MTYLYLLNIITYIKYLHLVLNFQVLNVKIFYFSISRILILKPLTKIPSKPSLKQFSCL